jgi:ribonuclease D
MTMFEKSIDKESINFLPQMRFTGKISLVSQPVQMELAVRKLSEFTVLGFDTEKKPAFLKGQYFPPSLVQLATEDEVYLFKLTDHMPDSLAWLCENPGIKKIGVAVRDDIKDLQRMNPFNPEGFEDLNIIAKDLGFLNYGIRNLSAIILQQRVSKGEQRSDWSKETLSESQKMYAAVDAWACLLMYNKLSNWGYI